MNYPTLRIDVKDRIAKITLNRPEKKNAMSPQLHRDMSAALDELRYEDEAAVLVITGAGNAFCAGMDLKEVFKDLKVSQPKEFDRIYRIAADEAVFGLSEINFRLFPGGSVSKSLANLMRPRDALLYGMSGRTFNGKKA